MNFLQSKHIELTGIYFISLVLGVVVTDLAAHYYGDYVGEINFLVYDLDKLAKISLNEFFLSIVLKRVKQFILLYLWAIFLPDVLVFGGYLAFFSFSLGCFLSIETIHFGFSGILFSFFYFFPHYIFYIILFLLLFYRVQSKKENLPFQEERMGGKDLSKRLIRSMIFSSILLMGCFLEAYFNPKILQYIGRI